MLLTHNSAVEPSATAVSDVQNQLQSAQPPQLVAALAPTAGEVLPQCCATEARTYICGWCLCCGKACSQAWANLGIMQTDIVSWSSA